MCRNENKPLLWSESVTSDSLSMRRRLQGQHPGGEGDVIVSTTDRSSCVIIRQDGGDEASRSSAAAAGYRSAVLSNWIHTVVGIDNRELWFDTTVAAIDRGIWWRYQAAGSIDNCDGRGVSISRVQVQQAEVSWATTAAMTVCVCVCVF